MEISIWNFFRIYLIFKATKIDEITKDMSVQREATWLVCGRIGISGILINI